ncbi:MAG: hypothetical protein L0154_26545, partial [Chloroflexi bacterium]|nr:hypothetical protein [Chloroflexota bacterium]
MRPIIWTLLIVTLLLPLTGYAQAYPGKEKDEKCEELVAQALAALEAGEEVEEPDCVSNPGMSAMEMR